MAEDFYVDPIECMGADIRQSLRRISWSWPRAKTATGNAVSSGSHGIKRKKIKPVRESGVVVAGQQRTEATTNGSWDASLF